jgi:plastocyanin
MRKVIVLATVAVCSAALAVPAFAATKNIKVGDTGASKWFISKAKNHGTVTAKVGDTVKWTWAGKFPHNVTVSKGPVKFKSKTQTKGTFSKKITRSGTYTIFCSVHTAAAQSMKLKVTS